MSELLTANKISASVQGRVLFQDLSFNLESGQSMVLRGPNGVGKSSLLRGFLGLRPLAGNLRWHISGDEIGYLPQLELGEGLPWMNVQDFVESGVKWSIWRGPFAPKRERSITHELLKKWELDHLKDFSLNHLSKGQLQKVAWIRTFRINKKVYLLDEPFTFMDAQFREKGLAHMENLKSQGVSFISVFHDTDIPKNLEDLTVRLV